MPNKQYPLSPNTIGWKALEKLNPEERVEILQETKVWDEANKINDKVDLMLWFKQEENTQIIEKIEDKNHPKALGLKQWLNQNPENQKWYDENLWNNFNLVDDWIMILWDTFELEDEKATDNWKDIWNDEWNTYFTFDSAQDYAKKIWKTIPVDWSKYTDFLPWNNENKLNFLKNVLGLSYAGCRIRYDSTMYTQGSYGYYWSSSLSDTDGYCLRFNSTNINPSDSFNRNAGFSIRCIKN